MIKHYATKHLLFIAILLCVHVSLNAQLNTELIGHLAYPEEANDVWGYVAQDGTEYALIGLQEGTSVVNLSEPSQPQEAYYASGANSTWRDIKTWNDYMYVTNERGGGLQIVDLGDLPDVNTDIFWTGGNFQGQSIQFQTAHNFFVDENGIGYVIGSDFGIGGAILIDLAANPIDPPIVGIYENAYIHDLYARGDTMWTAEIYEGQFAVVDIKDKANPVVLATQSTPHTFTHNTWLSDDSRTLFTTDERSSAFVGVYDVSDIQDIKELDRYQSNPNSGVIPHNVFVRGDFIITSYYRDGITIADWSHPKNVIETGQYDTAPTLSGNSYNGCWGVYPYLPSGLILASDIEEGLFVVKANYTKACYLEGILTDANTGQPIFDVDVHIVEHKQTATKSDLFGEYKTGTGAAGNYSISFRKSGYAPKTIDNVSLTNGELTNLSVVLDPLTAFSIQLQVLDEASNQPIAETQVILEGIMDTLSFSTNANGQTVLSLFETQTYEVYVGKWGYKSKLLSAQNFDTNTGELIIELEKGYYDDFFFDFGWMITGDATRGIWERDAPEFATYQSTLVNPAGDINGDIGKKCYVTGAKDGLVNNVGSGTTRLISPIFDLSNHINPVLSYNRWLYLQSGSDDELIISLSNGNTNIILETADINDDSRSQWKESSFALRDLIDLTNNMQLSIEIADLPESGNIVNAAFDGFTILEENLPIQPPVAQFSADKTAGCPESSIQFSNESTNEPTSFLWTFEGGTPNTSTEANPVVVYSESGNYAVSLTATNEAGNHTQNLDNYVNIHKIPYFELALNQVTACPNEFITIELVNEALTDITYEWAGDIIQNSDSRFLSIAASESAVYTIQAVSSEGCRFEQTLVINMKQATADFFSFTTEVCVGDDIFLNNNSINAMSYQWILEETNSGNVLFFDEELPNIPTLEAGMYHVTLIAGGCGIDTLQKNSYLTVHPVPEFSIIINNQAVCAGEFVALSISGDESNQYFWYDENQEFLHEGTSLTVQPTDNTTYTVEAISVNNCVNAKSASIDYIVPADLSIEASRESACLGETVTLSASEGYLQFSWFVNGELVGESATLEAIISDNTTYELVAIDAIGCSNTANINIALDTSRFPIAEFSIPKTEICLGESLTINDLSSYVESTTLTFLNTETGNRFDWAMTDEKIVLEEVGVYDVSLTVQGCGTTEDNKTIMGLVTVFPSPPISIIVENENICVSEPTILTAVSDSELESFQWYGEGISSTEGAIAHIRILEPGGYTFAVLVTDVNGCASVDSAKVNVMLCPFAENLVAQQLFTLQPNPVHDYLQLTISSLEQNIFQKAKIELMNMLGQVVWQQAIELLGHENYTIPVHQLANGLYYVALEVEGRRYWQKVVVQ